MTDTETSSLGRALTALNMEDQFLLNGGLARFPLAERGRITQGIIAEKLRAGKWQTVIDMIYGGFGKADALFEGDRDALRDEIVASAREHAHPVKQRTLEALVKAREDDLLFRLATNILSLDYEDFTAMTQSINISYFKNPEQGVQRTHLLHETAGKKAFAEEKYHDAVAHFGAIDEKENITKVYNRIISDPSNVSLDFLEKAASSDPEQRQRRLKEIVQRHLSSEDGKFFRSVAMYQLVKEYQIPLSDEEKTALQIRVAKEAERYEIKGELIKDQELSLLWAKHHARDEPRTTYNLFVQYHYEGDEVMQAVQEGLSLERYKDENKDRALHPCQIKEDHLRKSFDSASFHVQAEIAYHLKDKEALRKLSRQAQKNRKYFEAYRLWVEGEGDLQGKHIAAIRAHLIKDAIENHSGYMSFLANTDRAGKLQAYDALMEQKKTDHFRHAYELALSAGDEGRTQRAREAMFAVNPSWALRNFAGTDKRDEKGIDYVITATAKQYGVEKTTLRDLVAQYKE